MEAKKLLFAELLNVNRPMFINIKNYTSSETGEVSNVLVLVNFSLENAKQRDLKILQSKQYEGITEEARLSHIQSIVSPNKAQSNAQKDSYEVVNQSIKIHNETGKVMIFGKVMKKTIIKAGTHKEVKSRELTIEKKKLSKKLKLAKDCYRQYIVDNITEVKIKGHQIILE